MSNSARRIPLPKIWKDESVLAWIWESHWKRQPMTVVLRSACARFCLIALALLGLVGCNPRAEIVTEGAHWGEPGSHAFRMVRGNSAYMDLIMPPVFELGPRGEWSETYTAGFCSDQPPYILAVWEGAPGHVTRHEFCHLVHFFHGHWQDALASLGPNVPAEIINFCIALSHCDPVSNYQWIELQRENPGFDVIGHRSILRDIHQFDIKPWSATNE